MVVEDRWDSEPKIGTGSKHFLDDLVMIVEFFQNLCKPLDCDGVLACEQF
jgi:hypothetical protein